MGEMCRGQCSEHFNWCVPIYIIVNSVGWELVLGGANASRVTWHHRLSWNIVTNHLPLIMNQFASKQSQRPKPIRFKAYRYILKITSNMTRRQDGWRLASLTSFAPPVWLLTHKLVIPFFIRPLLSKGQHNRLKCTLFLLSVLRLVIPFLLVPYFQWGNTTD